MSRNFFQLNVFLRLLVEQHHSRKTQTQNELEHRNPSKDPETETECVYICYDDFIPDGRVQRGRDGVINVGRDVRRADEAGESVSELVVDD